MKFKFSGSLENFYDNFIKNEDQYKSEISKRLYLKKEI